MELEERKKSEIQGRKRTVVDLGLLHGWRDLHRGWSVAFPGEGCLSHLAWKKEGYLGIQQCL